MTTPWTHFQQHYPSVASHLLPFETAARKRQDKGRYWWELRPCDYYGAFDQPKIMWPEMGRVPRFSWEDTGAYTNNKAYIASADSPWLLGLLNSRLIWFIVQRVCLNLGERAGMGVFQLFAQYVSLFPVPSATDEDKAAIGALAQEITTEAKARYALHESVRRRLLTDFGRPGISLNQKLTAWWTLDFSGLRQELVKVFKRDIPVGERDEWQAWLTAQQEAHRGRTLAIIAREADLNARVHVLFGLADAEVALIEAATKYRYGEV